MNLAPIEFISIDHFSYGNKSFLLAIDRASGYIFCKNVPNKTTQQVTKYLWKLFHSYGLPNIIRSDGAHCFSHQFEEWCDSLSIKHQTSSAYNSPSNGSAERGVKSVKALFDKDGVCVGDKLIEMIFLINRNSNSDNSGSPSEKFFRRRPRSNMPNSLRRDIDYRELQASRHRAMEKLALKKGKV